MSDLTEFRQETREWLEQNCPQTMRSPIKEDGDQCWGGRNYTFKSEDQKLWMQRMAARGWTAPDWPAEYGGCLLYTSPSPRDRSLSRMPSSA